jgi:hypothetical protein
MAPQALAPLSIVSTTFLAMNLSAVQLEAHLKVVAVACFN